MAMPLLTTKLYIPPVRPDLVPRPRLIERLNQGMTYKLTLISAPAGFGKTTLLSEWIPQSERPVCWVSLDPGDNDSTRFWCYFIAALQMRQRQLGENALSLLQSPQQPPIGFFLNTLLNEIAAFPDRFALVLDDYHAIETLALHDAIAHLVDHMPPQMHLVIATRADPSLPLAHWRARGQLTELRAGDLRFTPDEAALFLRQMMGLPLTAEQVAALDTRTEGWIAGLQLAALSMRGRQDISGFIAAFTGSHRYVLDYLMEEVFEQQSADVQDFLLKTSILDQLNSPLCDVVTGQAGSQATLERLERANLFIISLDDERCWYRYHRLFADLLHHRLRQAQRDLLPELHRRASEWYEREGLAVEAFQHTLAAGDLEQAVRLVEENARDMVRRGELATLLKWLKALPDEVARSRPRLCMAYAWALLFTGQAGAAEPRLQDAERALAQRVASPLAASDEHKIAPLLGEVALLRLLFARYQEDLPKTIELSQLGLEQIDEDDFFARGLVYLSLGVALRLSGDVTGAVQACTEAVRLCRAAGNIMAAMISAYNLSRLYGLQGQLHRAAETCRQVLQSAEGWTGPGLGMVYLGTADVLYEWNELAAAEQHVREALALGEPGGYLGLLINGYTLLARIRQACGDVQGAHQAIHKLEQAVQQRDLLQTSVQEIAAYRAWFSLMEGNLRASACWAQTIEPDPDDRLDTLREFQWITLVRVLLAQGRPDEARPLLERLLHTAEAEGRMGKVIEILALQALMWQACGDTAGALAALKRALALAEPEGYIRTFVDEGAPMARLLYQAASRGIAPKYVSELLASFDASEHGRVGETLPYPCTQPLIEPLTPREVEVLRLIAAGLMNQEIANQLFISVATVKRHITNIYSKLGVSHRTQALTRAQELSLL